MQRFAGFLAAALCLLPQSAAHGAGKPPASKPVASKKAPAKSQPKPQGKAAKPAKPAGNTVKDKAVADGAPRTGPDEAIRRSIAGGPTADDLMRPAETPELRALREAEREIFAPAAPRPGSPWPSDAVYRLPADPERPVVNASGLPPAQSSKELLEAPAEKTSDIAWIQSLKQPDLPVRWDERVVRYLQFFRDDPRGRSTAAYAWKRSGRYRDAIRTTLKAERLPEALLWVSMVESGFEPTIKSGAGAAGLWQFMPDGARIYGLRVDRWVDERLEPQLATQAAAKYLSDLYRRFGGWELALAAYNMGYGGLLSAMRKYNTNDFWELSRFEAGIPWETTLYVPKIIALAIVAENPQVFGLSSIDPEPAVTSETLKARGGTSIEALARATGASTSELETLNPHLRARRTPLDAQPATFDIHVPVGKAHGAQERLVDIVAREPRLARHTVRFGQTLETLATELGTSRRKLQELNGLSRDDYPRAGDVLVVPEGTAPRHASSERPIVVVPRQPQRIEGRERVFYKVIPGDTVAQIAEAFSVSADEVLGWNAFDPSVRLQEGTTLQLFVKPKADLSGVIALRESEAQVMVVGSEEFFTHFEAQKGRRRIAVTINENDSWKSISSRYACSVGMLERINRRSRSEPLRAGETLLVYTAKDGGDLAHDPQDEDLTPPIAPRPDDLPSPPEAAPPARAETASTR